MDNQKLREAFEKWRPVNGYGSLSLDEIAYKAWQAAFQSQPQAPEAGVDEMVEKLQTCIRSRDDFIVNRGLWHDFVSSLPRLTTALGQKEADNG